ncbi:MAG: hypothetical protein A2Y38_19975 [Spirochaetes bacterium GWB1_59_5]|nr:MAG: hypothetical protein A2Y38_19975 [Spirochaetes bacterium GWB1_59_5]
MSTFDFAKHIGFDLETSGKKPEYALQPFRALQRVGWPTVAAFCREGQDPLTLMMPGAATLKKVLQSAIEKKVVITGWNVSFDAAWLIAMGLEEEVFALQWLDAMLLWRHAVVEPEGEDVPQNKRKSYSLEAAMHEFYPEHAGFKEFTDFHTKDVEELKKLAHRCGQDTLWSLRLVGKFWNMLNERQQRAAYIEAQCIPQVALTKVQGLRMNVEAAHALDKVLEQTAITKLAELMVSSPEVVDVNVGSPKQLGVLLFDTWGLPCNKMTKGTDANPEGNRSTDKEVLFDLAALDPRARLLRSIREAKNCRSKYAEATWESVEYNGDGCSRPDAKIFGTYCVPGTTEVLTRDGWVMLRDWSGGEIAQVYPDRHPRIEFLPATRFIGPMVDEWVKVDHAHLTCLFTEGHIIPYLTQNTFKWATAHAGDLLSRRLYVPTAGDIQGINGSLTPEQMRVLVMFQADGYVCKTRGRYKFTFVKSRKVMRAKLLLKAAGVSYREYVCAAYPDRVEITIGVKSIPAWWLPEYKQFGSWVLDTTPEGLNAMVSELEHWDGSTHPDGGFRYISYVEHSISWAVTAAHLAGRQATIFSDGRSCHISDMPPRAQVHPDRHVSMAKERHQAYCATTQTGFWLARSNGKIFITGNTSRMTYSSSQKAAITRIVIKTDRKTKEQTEVEQTRNEELPTGVALHQWKRGKEFRSLIEAPEGFDILELDFAGQEFRWMAVASNDPTMLSLCAPGEDAHSYMGAQIAQMDYRTLVQLVHAEDKEAELQRKLGKFANLSFQYRVGPKTATAKARVDYELDVDELFIKQILATYKAAYPYVAGGGQIAGYWATQICKCRQLAYAETFAGRRVNLNGNWGNKKESWKLESTAINYPIQGTGGDQKYLALAVARNLLPKYNAVEVRPEHQPAYAHWARVYYELHDGLFFIIPKAKTQLAAHELRYALSNLPYKKAWGIDLPIQFPVDGKFGPSWGALKGF